MKSATGAAGSGITGEPLRHGGATGVRTAADTRSPGGLSRMHHFADVPIPRRSLFRGAFAVAAAGAGAATLAGCSSPVGAGLANTPLDPGTVQYWNLFGGGDGVRMQQMLAGYRKAHPDIPLPAGTLAGANPDYTKGSLATVGDKPPDVAVSHLTRMLTMQQGDLLQEL